MDYWAVTVGLERPSEPRRWEALMSALEDHAQEHLSGTTIRVASVEVAASLDAAEPAVGWLIATATESAIVILRPGLKPGEGVWHAARLCTRLAGSPLSLELGQVGLITSENPKGRSWPENSRENATDHAAIGLLTYLGASRRQALKYARFHV